MKLYQICLYFCITGAAISVRGQEPPACTQQLFDDAETSYRMRWRSSEIKGKAEHELNALVQTCPATPARYQAEEHLQVVREELAESNLQIAKFYLNKSNGGKGGKAGARSRLNQIVDKYPKYTKLDEALSLLGQVNMDGGYLDDAANCYQRLIKDFPRSQYAGEAYIQLSVIEVMRVNQNP